MATVAVATMAQNSDTEWYSNVPEGYLPGMTKEIISRESPCNQGEEAFMDFIPKFRKNATFRKSRIAIHAEDEMGASVAQAYDSWGIVKAKRGTENGVRFFGTWYNVRPDSVCFHYEEWPTDPDSPWGGSAAFFRFQRINGKWYLTGIMVAG